MVQRKLLLHVGPPKTGTSAVQHAMRQHEGSDLLYPRVGLWADGSHHNLVFSFFGDLARPEAVRGDAGHWLDEIASQAASHPGNVLLSSESLVGRDVDAFAQALLQRLQRGGDAWSAELLFACREHGERIASLYNQAVKDGVTCERDAPDAYLARCAKFACFGRLLRRLGAGGLPLRVLDYHPAASFVPRFLAAAGVQQPEAKPNEARNVSLSASGLVACLAINRAAGGTPARAELFDAMRRQVRPFFGKAGPLFSAEALQAAESVFAPDRELLAREHGVRLPPPVPAGRLQAGPAALAQIAAAAAPFGALGEQVLQHARAFAAPAPPSS